MESCWPGWRFSLCGGIGLSRITLALSPARLQTSTGTKLYISLGIRVRYLMQTKLSRVRLQSLGRATMVSHGETF
jgi:hypothetical protein